MAGYGLLGALGGLGDSLQMIGTTMFKTKLAEKLEAQRQENEDKRELAKEERAERRLRSRPDPNQSSFIERDGALFKQSKNAYGEVIDEALASVDEIDKRNYTRAKQKNEIALGELNIEGKGLLNRINAFKAEDADELSDLDLEVKRSMINKNNNQGLAAMIRANKTGSSRSDDDDDEASISDYANLLKKESKDVIEQYQEEDETLTATEVNKIMRYAVEHAVKHDVEPQIALQRILDEKLRLKRKQDASKTKK